MTRRDIAVVACKILGLYTMIQSLSYLPYLSWMPRLEPSERLVGLGQFALYLVAGLLLWLFAQRLAVRMIASPETLDQGTRHSELDIQRLAFTVMGLFVLVLALPRTGELLVELYYHFQGIQTLRSADIYSEMVGLLIRWVIGLWLLLSARGVVEMLHRVRGKSSTDSEEINE